MLKKMLCILSAVIFMASATGCNSNAKNEVSDAIAIVSSSDETSATEQTSQTAETQPEAAADETEAAVNSVSEGINPLTGESGYNTDAAGKRPVAIMVNNIKDSLPQYGIAQADIIYELPVEGGITRLMAVYADYTAVPDVCSVRSCRYYYPILCLGMDAIYCHWGEDKTIALDTLNRTGIDHLDGEYDVGTGVFYRDQERAATYASEHTGYIKGDELAAKIEEKGFRTDVNEENSGTCFNFASAEEKVTPNDGTASSVTLNFSSEYYSTFNYDAATGTYLKLHSGSPHMDGKTGTQLSFENVFVLQTDIHTRSDGYLMDVELTGGTGYYISNGSYQAITWSKETEASPIKVFDAAGNELTVNSGKSYIGIIGSEKAINFS